MKAITIHNLDDVLAGQLRKKAETEGESLNGIVKRILAEAMGMKPPTAGRHRRDFEAFSGAWSQRDAMEFERHTAEFENVDAEDWK